MIGYPEALTGHHDGRPVVFLNATVVTPFRIAAKACVSVEQGRISQLGGANTICFPPNARVVDLEGRYLLPGFIDLHVHGAKGLDFGNGDDASLEAMLDYFVSHGTTRLTATLYPNKKEALLEAVRAVAAQCRVQSKWRVLAGIHLEGPFLNKSMSGALDPDHFWDANTDDMLLLQEAGRGAIKLMTIAPEIPGAQGVMQMATQAGIVLCIAHSSAKYEVVEEAIDLGLSQVTHIFNAMAPMHHRAPGTLAAALLKRELKVHLIADGHHVHPTMVNLLYRLKGPRGIILISDAISACGQGDGPYTMADQSVTVEQGRAYLPDGTLVGSTTTLDKSLAFMTQETDVPLEEAVQMVTLNPARVLGLDRRKGVIAVGKDADLVVMNHAYGVEMTLVAGEILYASPALAREQLTSP